MLFSAQAISIIRSVKRIEPPNEKMNSAEKIAFLDLLSLSSNESKICFRRNNMESRSSYFSYFTAAQRGG